MSDLRAFWNGDEPRRVIVQLPPIGKDGRCPRCGEEPSADTLSCGCHRPIIEAVEALDHDGCEPECPWPGEHRAQHYSLTVEPDDSAYMELDPDGRYIIADEAAATHATRTLMPPGPHFSGDVSQLLYGDWDLLIAHPPCTDLAVSGARWFKDKGPERIDAALAFVQALMDAPIPRIAIENPISIISSRIRKPDQIVQPWMFGHPETKATCLWLKGLLPLVPTNIVDGREPRVHHASPGPDRWKERSRTLQGIADAMADQWADLAGDVAG